MQAEDAGIREIRGRPWRQCFDEALRSAESQLQVQRAPAVTQAAGFEQLCLDGACTYFAIYLHMQRLGARRTEGGRHFTYKTGALGLGQARKRRCE